MQNGRSLNIDAVQSTSVESGTKMTCTFQHFQLFFDIFFCSGSVQLSTWRGAHVNIFSAFTISPSREKKRKDNVWRWEMMLCAESDISRVFRWKSYADSFVHSNRSRAICAPALLDMSQLSSWSPIDTRFSATIP